MKEFNLRNEPPELHDFRKCVREWDSFEVRSAEEGVKVLDRLAELYVQNEELRKILKEIGEWVEETAEAVNQSHDYIPVTEESMTVHGHACDTLRKLQASVSEAVKKLEQDPTQA